MNHARSMGAAMICVAVTGVGLALYEQNEGHFSESQRWLEVCKRQQDAMIKAGAEKTRDEPSIPDEVRRNAQLGIEGWDGDYLYSRCFKEWHAGN